MQARELLIGLSIKNEGDWEKIYTALRTKEIDGVEEYYQEYIKDCGDDSDTRVITMLDPEYPESLKKIYKPPFVLFCKGDATLLQSTKIVGVVGALQGSLYALDQIKKTVASMAPNGKSDEPAEVIVTTGHGRSMSTARAARVAAAENGLKTIAVLSEELAQRNPDVKADLFITECPPHVLGHGESTARMIGALSSKRIIAGEVGAKTASAYVIEWALSLGKDVDVIPLQNGTPYINNTLIRDGAGVIIN